ncbi:hypothetical protein [Schinkia azotoformans]|uniref:hypothetical protein n=1 Tax=Schinkia azotoformans TaxID=1454 RepID=UPI002DB90F50|nr:hypothetical protein [Schinkia azotoformans]MEC1720603.1 hypothetical protein [Schinkia azotoformans]MED4411742.1 hypothetical protein [Schinkia azotoformans]
MKNYFFCYNKKLSDFLTTKGIQFITVAKEPKSGKLFSLYFIDTKLQQAIEEYKQSK